MTFGDLWRAASPFIGAADATNVRAGQMPVKGNEWTRLGNSDYELRLNMGWQPVRWVVLFLDDGTIQVGAQCVGGPEVIAMLTGGRPSQSPALLGHSMQWLGSDATLDARLRYNPSDRCREEWRP